MNFLKKQENYRNVPDIVKYKNNIILYGNLPFKIVSFASNNYLGLNFNKTLINAGIKTLKEHGTGAGASCFIEGHHPLYTQIINLLIKNKGCEDAMVFTSGFTCNIAIFSTLAKKGDVIFLDEASHSSSFEGVKLSGAKIIRFKHNNINSLKEKLQKYNQTCKGNIFIGTETIFSMQGTVLQNPKLYIDLAKEYNAVLVTDEAHSLGIMEFDFPKYEMHLKMGTFSKAVGVLGGYVCGNKILIEALRQFAKPAIYTTALPPHILAIIYQALNLIFTNKITAQKAIKNASTFCKLLQIKPASQIVFLELQTNKKALKMEEELLQNGFFAKAIRKPTVKTPGIRFSFNNLHKTVDIKKLAFIIKQNL